MDNGGEYVSTDFRNWCSTKGIVLDYTPPYTPQLNSHAERLGRTLMDKTRSILFDSGLEKEMWGEALLTATYLLNRSPTKAVNTTPAEIWYERKPDYSRLRQFGTIAYVKNLKSHKKLDERAKKLIFIGYHTNCYRLWDNDKRKIVYSRDVYFTNEKFQQIKPDNVNILLGLECDDENTENENGDAVENENDLSDTNFIPNLEESEITENETRRDDETPAPALRRSSRIKKLPEKLKDYDLDFESDESAFLTYEEAVSCEDKEKWIAAMQDEKDSLAKNETWTLVDPSEANGRKILTSRWVLRIKDDGKYKARIVVRGFQQTQGEDYTETFSPVVGSESIRIVLALAIKNDQIIKKFDVKTAFLHGTLNEEIYMRLPQGYETTDKICKLQRSLYGLKQAPARWNDRLVTFLKQNGLEQLKSDHCIFDNSNTPIYSVNMEQFRLTYRVWKRSRNLQGIQLAQKIQNRFSRTPSNWQKSENGGIALRKSSQSDLGTKYLIL
ncbi:unnamed protein product, partial [Nesidiocoris tenuis]